MDSVRSDYGDDHSDYGDDHSDYCHRRKYEQGNHRKYEQEEDDDGDAEFFSWSMFVYHIHMFLNNRSNFPNCSIYSLQEIEFIYVNNKY